MVSSAVRFCLALALYIIPQVIVLAASPAPTHKCVFTDNRLTDITCAP
ncbi:hypothetical protein PC116_g8900 [Phytophthora cactorum]|uniref:Uncharacterized protein n=1 Tax=Phytophthora cactorum TaxID=29920 RepID=A0A329SIF5_9STRA|nr:hypothetical protein PC116_g8900 [Phytophthora cactorum]RAW36519.1 hypothetical protein PC110_g7231 [Phytophthora cactorum]